MASTHRPPSDEALLLRLRTRQLLLVALVGRERNLGRAASAMAMSQPAATKLLQQVEGVLGAQLFTRQARGMEATAAGEVVIRYARQVLVDFGHARQQIASLQAGLQGNLRVGSVPGALPQLVAPALAAFKRTHPQVSVALLVETSDAMLDHLRRGEVDLVVGRPLEGRVDARFRSVPLLEEPHVVVVRQGHSLLRRKRLVLADLLASPWVLQPPGSPQRTRFETALLEAGITVRPDITETASTVATTALLECSDMVAIMPLSLARHYGALSRLRVLPFELPLRVPSIHLITSARELSPAAQAFVEVLRT
jgi:DNA-binding transcriptional LysR family regulator